ncbi:MAG: FG-GAP repeat domain-containing protein, partial [Flavisolibacter sp.]
MKRFSSIIQAYYGVTVLIAILLLGGCQSHKKKVSPMFTVLRDDVTGIHFANKLTPSNQFNMFYYMYFYNGAGIGAGDFNNDGKIDLFFASNQQENRLYLNKGKMVFADVTKEAGIPQDGGWSTGVSVVD